MRTNPKIPAAVQAIIDDPTRSYARTAREFGVPLSTLADAVRRVSPKTARRRSRFDGRAKCVHPERRSA